MTHQRTTGLVPLSALLTEASGLLDARVTDLVADLATDPVEVVDVVGSRDLAPFAGPRPKGTRLDFAVPVRDARAPARPTELCLQRDLLDTRVWNPRTRRPTRVGEIWLRTEPGRPPEVAGLEVGMHPVWRRLTTSGRAERPGQHLLDLASTPLLSRHGRAAQAGLAEPPTSALTDEELAHLVTHLSAEAALELLDELGAARAAAVLGRLHPRVRDRLARARTGGQPGEHRRSRRTAGWRVYPPDGD